MSGVSGSDRIYKDDIPDTLDYYYDIISKFPKFIMFDITGSFHSNKTSFGDIDLVVLVDSKDKKQVKKELVNYFNNLNDDIIIPFKSEKYLGYKSYNSGEIVSINFPQKNGCVQIDNIIAITEEEFVFKMNFLNLSAEIQGLYLGLIKTALIDKPELLDYERFNTPRGESYEFNLSSSELQLRSVIEQEKDGNLHTISHKVVWRCQDWNFVLELLSDFDLSVPFDDLLEQIETKCSERSITRIKGIFNSMVSVKSGEKGTTKGFYKELCINKVNHIGESSGI